MTSLFGNRDGSWKVIFIFIGVLMILIISVILYANFFVKSEAPLLYGKANDAQRQLDIGRIQLGLEKYYEEHNIYPSSLNELTSQYMQNMPIDPSTKQPYQYQLQSGGADYTICVDLESVKTRNCATSQSPLRY